MRALYASGMNVRVDADLVLAARAGDESAFKELVERYQSAVSSLAYALTGDLLRSEDVAQDVFVRAWRQLPKLRDAERVRSWLYAITRNVSRTYPRLRSREVAIDMGMGTGKEIVSAEPSALERIIDREDEQLIWAALEKVPETYKLPLILFYREQQSIQKVADALDLSEEVVKMRLLRGRKMLHDRLARQVEAFLSRPRRRKQFVAAVAAAVASTRPRRSSSSVPAGAAVVASAALLGSVMFLGGLLRAPQRSGAGRPAGGMVRTASIGSLPLLDRALTVAADVSMAPDPARNGSAVFTFDFEDGVLPPQFQMGHVTPGPPGSPSHHCVMGTIAPNWFGGYFVKLSNEGLPLSFDEDAVLGFDYWVGDDFHSDRIGIRETPEEDAKTPISVTFYDNDLRQGYRFAVRYLAHEAWTHVELPLSAFRAVDETRHPRNGDSIGRIAFHGGWVGGKPLYVDNIMLAVKAK